MPFFSLRRAFWAGCIVFFFGAVFIPSEARGQYIADSLRLQDYTEANYVSMSKPKWIGPHNWYWLPRRDYDIKVVNTSSPRSYVESQPPQTCIITRDRVYNPNGIGKAIYCNPPINRWTYKECKQYRRPGLCEDPGPSYPKWVKVDKKYQLDQVGDANWDSPIAGPFAETREGGGYGEVVFAWNWRKHTVNEKRCDRKNVGGMSRQDLVDGSSNVALSQEEMVEQDKRVMPEDINIPVHICSDDTEKRQPGKFAPYETFEEQSLAQKKCNLDLIKKYDGGHRPGGDYSTTWRSYVPEGWFLARNDGFNKEDFMDWCVNGGPNPFSPEPYPGIQKDKFDTRKVFNGGDIGEFGSPDQKRPWEKATDFAGDYSDGLRTKPGGPNPAGADSLLTKATRKCSRLYNEIANRRQGAFMDLCRNEEYSFFNGCKQELKRCKGYENNDIEYGVSQCCTDSYPEYHYHQKKTYEVPCKPMDAYLWDGRGGQRDRWEDPKSGVKADYGGVTGTVKRLSDRGFVGEFPWLSLVGGDGETMTVQSDSVKIGSYFWFDLKNGTVGIRSFEEKRYKQEVALPGPYRDAGDNEDWEWGNVIRGSKEYCFFCGPPFTKYDNISNQRGKCNARDTFSECDDGGDIEGFLYHLYFCEETFTEDELKLIQVKWETVPEQIDEMKDEFCADGEEYRWNPSESQFQCMPAS